MHPMSDLRPLDFSVFILAILFVLERYQATDGPQQISLVIL